MTLPAPAGLRRPGFALDHVAFAARSFAEIVPTLERASGTGASAPVRVESQGVEACFVGQVEVIVPLAGDAGDNSVSRFLERRGPGLHHMAYRVENVARAMEELAAEGYEFTSQEPSTGAGGHRVAFLHPRSTGGLLIEIVEKASR